jgi:hypothetical protein
MLKVWVDSIEQLELDIILETLEKRVLLLLVGVDIIGGIPRQLNELIQVFIHHHIPLIQFREFLLLLIQSAAGHIMSPEASLELIPGDGLNIGMGVTVSLPLVCCSSK